MPLKWSTAFSTGITSIDEQHRELITVLNDLQEALATQASVERIGEVIAFLGNYAQRHFIHEEQCMDAARCPAAQANKDAHTAFCNTKKNRNRYLGSHETLFLRKSLKKTRN